MNIYKYRLNHSIETEIVLPIGSVVLNVEVQEGEPHIWIMVADNPSKESRFFHGIMTGGQFDWKRNWNYIGTVHALSGRFVVHYFEVIK